MPLRLVQAGRSDFAQVEGRLQPQLISFFQNHVQTFALLVTQLKEKRCRSRLRVGNIARCFDVYSTSPDKEAFSGALSTPIRLLMQLQNILRTMPFQRPFRRPSHKPSGLVIRMVQWSDSRLLHGSCTCHAAGRTVAEMRNVVTSHQRWLRSFCVFVGSTFV